MLGAIGTTFCFALTPIFARGAGDRLGSLAANFWRLVIAAIALAFWAHWLGRGLTSPARAWFFIGGVAGFGLGGVAMFLSLPRLGSSLSTLIVQCGSAIVAAIFEYVWLGTSLHALQILSALATLAGVAIGLLPRSLPRVAPERFRAGVAWAVISAVGQGTGAVVSRKAFAVAATFPGAIDPGTAAYYRVIGGLVVALLVFAPICVSDRRAFWRNRAATPWVLANALTGPILGVTLFQWALRTTPAGLVQTVVATAPLLTIPLAVAIEHAAPPRRLYYVGALLAVAGSTGIALTR